MKCFPHEPLSESIVFLYCQHLSQKQPDSSAPDQLCQALNFADGVLGLAVAAKTLVSARVQGLAHQCMRQQKPPKQAPALTTDQVRWLQTFAQSDEPQYERYLAASFLFMIYARARHSDLRRSQDLSVDCDEDGHPVYIECRVLNPKQSKASRRRNMFLPLVAPAVGICQEPWATEWLELRSSLGLVRSGNLTSSPLLPDLAADGSLLQTNMDSSSASRWLRCILSKQPGSSLDDILRISSQGLKGKSGSALSYGRDALAGPLRTLEKVLQDARESRFKPDSTRSGRWQTQPSQPAASSSVVTTEYFKEQPELEAVSDSSSSAPDVESEGSSADDTQLLQSVSHSLALVAGDQNFQFLTNVRSGVVHISRRQSDRLLCGRTAFSALKVTPTVDFSVVKACITCQAVADGLIAGKWASTAD